MRVSTHVLATAFVALTLSTTACENSTSPTAVPEGAALGARASVTVASTPGPIASSLSSTACADVYQESTKDGTPVVLWSCNDGTNQQFSWRSNGTVTVFDSKCLTVSSRARTNDRATIASCNGSAGQQWKLTDAMEIRGVKDRCLTAQNGSAAKGTALVMAPCDGSAAQKWTVPAATTAPAPTPVPPADTAVTPPPSGTTTPPPDTTTAPAPTPPATTTPPTGSYVAIIPGQSIQAAVDANPNGTQFLIKAGVHRQQSVSPKSGDVFVGEVGAVLDGENATPYAFTTSSATSVTIRGLKITNYASSLTGGTIHADNSVSWIVSDNEISYGGGVGIRMGRGMQVLRNNIHHNRHSGIDGTKSDGALVEGNTIANNATAHSDVDGVNGDAAGMKIFRTRGVVTRNNVVKDNWGPGVWYDIDNFDAVIEGNTITGNTHRGIFYEVSYNGIIRNNMIANNGYGVGASWISNAGIFVVSSADVEIYGNTIQGNRQGITAAQTARGSGPYGEYLLQNLYVHDNKISMSEGMTGVDEAVGSSAVFGRNLRFVNNSYTLGSNSTYFLWRYLNLDSSGWRAQGQDVNGTFNR